MTLPQLYECLRACDRRDASLALQQLQITYSAHAPLIVGDKGRSLFDKCASSLRAIISPREKGAGAALRRIMEKVGGG